jgi:hypothetical protein
VTRPVVLETVPSEVLAVVARALGCTPLNGRAVFVNDQLPGGFLLVERDTLLNELRSTGSLALEMIEELRTAPTCKIPLVYRFGGRCGAAVMRRGAP